MFPPRRRLPPSSLSTVLFFFGIKWNPDLSFSSFLPWSAPHVSYVRYAFSEFPEISDTRYSPFSFPQSTLPPFFLSSIALTSLNFFLRAENRLQSFPAAPTVVLSLHYGKKAFEVFLLQHLPIPPPFRTRLPFPTVRLALPFPLSFAPLNHSPRPCFPPLGFSSPSSRTFPPFHVVFLVPF